MPEISQIKLPSGNVYDIKDATARRLIANGTTKTIAWKGDAIPVVADIPAGVVVTYNGNDYTGTLAASSAAKNALYLVYNTDSEDNNDVYDEYAVVNTGTELSPTYAWEKIGSTKVDLSGLGALAYKDNVSASGMDTFVKSYNGATSKMVTTTLKGVAGTTTASDVSHTSKKMQTASVPNVTNAGAASTWAFAMGTDNTGSGGVDESETLIISGANGSAPTLGTPITAATGNLVATSVTTNVGDTIVDSVTETSRTVATADAGSTTVATGSLDANGGGDSVMTGLGTPTTAQAVTGIAVS